MATRFSSANGGVFRLMFYAKDPSGQNLGELLWGNQFLQDDPLGSGVYSFTWIVYPAQIQPGMTFYEATVYSPLGVASDPWPFLTVKQ